MEKQKYKLDLSLEQVIFRKIAICLWQHADILELVNSFYCQSFACDDTIQKWQDSVENVVKERISELSEYYMMPEFLKEELIQVVKPIGPEMLKWKMHLESLISDPYIALDQLCWTTTGTVDYQKTAKVLIKQKRIADISRYKLACTYCMEDDIRSIWETLSEESKKILYNETDVVQVRQSDLVIFWTYFINGEVARLNVLTNGRSPFQYAFERAALSGNRIATEYYFQLLTDNEIKASLMKTTQRLIDKRCFDVYNLWFDFPKENLCGVICYLLYQMKEEDQIEVFRENPYKTLRCFMDWPWTHIFMEIAELVWNFLPDHKYESLIMILANNCTMTGYHYPQILGDFFLRAPCHYRKYLIDKHYNGRLWFSDLIYTGNKAIIRLVLRNVDDEDRHKFIICETGYRLCWRLIEEGKWVLLELYVSECKLTNRAKTILKNTFMFYVTRFYSEEEIKSRKVKYERFFLLINNANVNEDNEKIVKEAEKEEQLMRKKQKRNRI